MYEIDVDVTVRMGRKDGWLDESRSLFKQTLICVHSCQTAKERQPPEFDIVQSSHPPTTHWVHTGRDEHAVKLRGHES